MGSVRIEGGGDGARDDRPLSECPETPSGPGAVDRVPMTLTPPAPTSTSIVSVAPASVPPPSYQRHTRHREVFNFRKFLERLRSAPGLFDIGDPAPVSSAAVFALMTTTAADPAQQPMALVTGQAMFLIAAIDHALLQTCNTDGGDEKAREAMRRDYYEWLEPRWSARDAVPAPAPTPAVSRSTKKTKASA